MSDLLLFVVFLPIYLILLIVSGLVVVVLFVGAIFYVPAKLAWSLLTGRDLGAGW